MSGIIGSKFNHRGSGLVGSLGTDGQHMLSSGAGKKHVFETVAAAESYDDEPIKSDLTALAIREATNESSAAFNLPGSFIETFTNDTNLGTETDGASTSGYWRTISVGSLSHQAITGFSSGGGSITCGGTEANQITYSEDGDSNQGVCYTTAQSVTGYMTADLGASYRIAKIEVGKGRNNGDPTGIVLTSSTDDSTYSNIDLSGASSAVVSYNGSNPNLSNFASDGTADWTAHTSQGDDVICAITGFSSTARYFRYKLGSAVWGDSNAHWTQFKLYSQAVTEGGSATGTLIQSANAVTGTRTEVGGTMLYADEEGTATLGTDLKIYFTCDGGSNWTETDTYTAITPVYASGIKQVRLGKMTCTGGTDVRYKAVFANQSDGSLETRLHAIGINY